MKWTWWFDCGQWHASNPGWPATVEYATAADAVQAFAKAFKRGQLGTRYQLRRGSQVIAHVSRTCLHERFAVYYTGGPEMR